MNCLTTNLQSLVNKKVELLNLLKDKDIHVVFITETWLTDEHAHSEYHLEGYQDPIMQMRDKGGCAIYVKEQIAFTEVQMPEKCNDSAWIAIQTQNRKTRLYGCVYRSPNSPASNNVNLLNNLTWARENYDELLITGDFNLPTIIWDTDEATGLFPREFLTTTSEMNLEQMVTQFTRFRHGQNPSLLDLILTDQPEMIQDVNYLSPLGKSDHIVINFSVKNAYQKRPKKRRLNHRKIREEEFRSELRTHDWRQIICEPEQLTQAFRDFNSIIVQGIRKYTPSVRNQNPPRAPWAGHKIRKLAENKRKKWDKYRYTGTDETYEEYKEALNLFTREKNAAIRTHETKLVKNKCANPKPYYKYLSSRSRYKSNQISLLNELNTIISDEKPCGTILNKYFSSVFTKGESDCMIVTPYTEQVMSDLVITEEIVKEQLLSLDVSKAMGPDEIPGYILKTFANELSYPLTLLFNRMYEEGIVPETLKCANVIPIHKKGNKNLAITDRLVSPRSS